MAVDSKNGILGSLSDPTMPFTLDRAPNGEQRIFKQSPHNKSRSRSPGIRHQSRSPKRSRSPGRERRRKRSRSSDDRTTKMVYISNIPYDVRWMDLKDLVRNKAGDVSFVEMIEKDGRSRGCAVVEFKNVESVNKCMDTMNRMELGDRRLVVKDIRDSEMFFRKIRQEHGIDFMANKSFSNRGVVRGRSAMGGGNSNAPIQPFGYETYGLSSAFLHQIGIDGPLCNRVFVANLPFSVSSGKLREVFSLAGQVVDVDLQLDKDGKTKGLAVVEYSHPIEAVQSISMLNGQELFDRAMTVKMDRFEKSTESRRPGELPVGLHRVGMGLGASGAPLINVSQLAMAGNFGPVRPTEKTVLVSNDMIGGGVSSSAFFGGGGGGSSRGRMESPPPPARFYVSGSDAMVGASSRLPAPAPSMFSLPGSAAFPSLGGSSGGGSGAYDYFRERERERERDRELDYRSMDRDHGASLEPPRSGERLYGSSSAFVGPVGGGSAPVPLFEPMASGGRHAAPVSPYSGYGSSNTNLNLDSFAPRGVAPPVNSTDFDTFSRRDTRSSPKISGGTSKSRSLRAILIRNLPTDYSWQTLRERMRGFGDVEFADMIQPGVGKVRFKYAADAEKACVSLHGMHVEGRPITVDLVNSD